MTPAPGADSRGRTPHIAEAAITAIGGASLGALVGAPFGLSIPLGAIAGINGTVCGWRGTYDWRSPVGVVGFVLDSTWAFATTAGALLAHVAAAVRGDPQFHDELSRRHNRHVYGRGFQIRPRFAFTLGNVVAGGGDLSSERRRRLITDHEDVHVWQARWFGPLYPVLYVGWLVGGGGGQRGRLGGAPPPRAVRQGRRVVRLLPQPVRVVGLQPRRPLAAEGPPRRHRLEASGGAAVRPRRALTRRPA